MKKDHKEMDEGTRFILYFLFCGGVIAIWYMLTTKDNYGFWDILKIFIAPIGAIITTGVMIYIVINFESIIGKFKDKGIVTNKQADFLNFVVIILTMIFFYILLNILGVL